MFTIHPALTGTISLLLLAIILTDHIGNASKVAKHHRKLLIIGANGRVGSTIARHFVEESSHTTSSDSIPGFSEIRLFVRNKNTFKSPATNILSRKNRINVEICEGDILDLASLMEATKGIDTVIDVHGTKRYAKLSDLWTDHR